MCGDPNHSHPSHKEEYFSYSRASVRRNAPATEDKSEPSITGHETEPDIKRQAVEPSSPVAESHVKHHAQWTESDRHKSVAECKEIRDRHQVRSRQRIGKYEEHHDQKTHEAKR